MMSDTAHERREAFSRLDRFPRTRLTFLPTPLVELRRLGRLLGGPRLLMKRDDMTGLGLGGNKTRKVEFLLGEALAQGCDTVITGGATQSNHCRQTSAAAAAAGLECHLALGGTRPDTPGGNLLLDLLFGAVVHWCGENRKGERIPEIAEELRAKGRVPYVIPYGGSNAVGALGLVAAIVELRGQLEEQGQKVDCLVVASSSGGTHAGMVVGLDLCGLAARVVGIGIDKGGPGEGRYESRLAALANEVAALLHLESRYTEDRFDVRNDYLGAGYGAVGDLEREAIRLVARHEGVLLDPVYTGRAMGGLVDLIRKGEFGKDETVLFWHTGGAPAVFAYGQDLLIGNR